MKYLIILFFIAAQLQAQMREISGRITDASDDSPVSLANIYLSETQTGTSSTGDGSFILKAAFSTHDTLIISHLGYETIRVPVSLIEKAGGNVFTLKSKIISSQTILVKGSIAKEGITPVAYAKLKSAEIRQSYVNQDIPEMLSYLPSSTFYSENGNGIGYNYLSIRGFDQRRISVSVNGIPQNDPEDHNVYWLDFPDLLESTELIQVQRSAGAGVVGYPAIGGSINIITSSFSNRRKLDLLSSIGSYNMRKYGFSFSSGLIDNKYSFYAKVSQILSSGYRNSSWTNFKSYHLSAVRFDDNITTQINLYGGPVADALAYTGLPKFTIKDRNLRKANYSYWEAENNNYTYTLERRPDEIENFSQPHFELLNEIKLNDAITVNSALYLVLGEGFFDYDGSWADTSYFRITKEFGFNPSVNPGNALIRAMVNNKQWGWIPRVSIKHDRGELILGGEMRLHSSVHWGSINYADNLPEGVTKDYRYYYYEGGNKIFNLFAHENFNASENLNILAEAQLAFHRYNISNEKYLNNDFTVDGLYFNPRLGINYKLSAESNLFGSFARVTREPRLKNYYDAAESSGGEVPQFKLLPNGKYDFTSPLVQPETMNDIEIGGSYSSGNISASLNLFYMIFDNEIVKLGQVDRFGQPVTGNIDRTIHSGIELTGAAELMKNLQLIFNFSYSKNYISKGSAFVKYYNPDKTVGEIDLSGNEISGFPDVTMNAVLKYQDAGFTSQLSFKYVGSFYSDNYGSGINKYLSEFPGFLDYSDNKVDSYFTANFLANYEFGFEEFPNKVKLFLQVNNIFDNLYAAYAIGKEFFPAAERSFNFGINLGI